MILLGKCPAHTKAAVASITSHCLFLVITSGTVESVGQGKARTPSRAAAASDRCSLMIIAEEEGGKEGGGGGACKRREKKKQAARLVVDVAPPTLPHTGPQHGAIVLPLQR